MMDRHSFFSKGHRNLEMAVLILLPAAWAGAAEVVDVCERSFFERSRTRLWQAEIDTVRAESPAMFMAWASSVLRKRSRFRSVMIRASVVFESCLASSGADQMLMAVSMSFGISTARLMRPATDAAAPSASIDSVLAEEHNDEDASVRSLAELQAS